MRVIEDAQDKMPEGEYLAAMNALGALHRVVPGAGAAVVVPAVAGAGGRGGVLFGARSGGDGGGDGVLARSEGVWCVRVCVCVIK
jgi:hypothetical protein